MFSPMIQILTPELADALKQRSNAVLKEIVQANSKTIYFRECPLLARLRQEFMAHCKPPTLVDGSLDLTNIMGIFAVVPLSVDKDYAPFIARFNEIPCRASRVRDLLAPGDDDGRMIIGLPLCFGIGGSMRMQIGVGFGNDRNFMSQKCNNITSPFAAYLIQPYRSILLVHGLFALADRSLTEVMTTFGVLFYECVKLLVLVETIRSGRLPVLDGLAEVAVYLQARLQADPLRATELQAIIVESAGWLKKVWPQLTNIRGIFTGLYSEVVPKLRHQVGPSVSFISTVYISNECHAGSMYDIGDHNLFKIGAENFVEYLDTEKSESIFGLCQAWEIEIGRRYELVVTTNDGRWRYRLGDVLEVAGFDPTDGQPLVRYIEHRTRISALGLRIQHPAHTRSYNHSLYE